MRVSPPPQPRCGARAHNAVTGRSGMSVILGSGEHRYRVMENWAKLPEGWNLADVASVAVDSKDRIYVFNRGAHPMVVLDREGNFIKSWGEGLFSRAHGLHIDAQDNLYCTDDGGWVYVADRENHRVQVFDRNGKYEAQWNHLHRPCALYCCGGSRPNFVVGELGPGMPVNRKMPNLGPRLSIVDTAGKRIARLGGENGPGLESGKFLAPHGIALDSRGDIYVGEVGVTDWKTSFPDTPMPSIVRCLQKLEKI